MQQYKDIHIGSKIQAVVTAQEIDMQRIEKFFKTDEEHILQMYQSKSLDAELLLKWCKLLDYNFFLYYHSHLQLYSPSASTAKTKSETTEKAQAVFRKNIYTQQVQDFLLELVVSGKMTPKEVIRKYNLPKVTLYTWMRKHKKIEEPKNDKKKTLPEAKTVPNYSLIYQDIVQNMNVSVTSTIREKINSINKSLDVLQVNEMLFEQGVTLKSTQQMRSYLPSDKSYILEYQKKEKLNNIQTANHFKMSRNTIAKWKQEANAIKN